MKASKETIIRTIITFITLINMVLTMIGKNPLPWSETEIYTTLSGVASVLTTIWAWWKNNSFTQEAISADKYMKILKEENND